MSNTTVKKLELSQESGEAVCPLVSSLPSSLSGSNETTCMIHDELPESASAELRSGQIKSAFIAALPHTLPVLASFLILGMTYGVLMQTKGYGVIWSVLMSAVAFCGSMQFVAITLLTVAFNPLQAFLLSLTVNARHLFYGLSMLEKYKGLGKLRGFLIYTLCDETFSICCTLQPPEGVLPPVLLLCRFVSKLRLLGLRHLPGRRAGKHAGFQHRRP